MKWINNNNLQAHPHAKLQTSWQTSAIRLIRLNRLLLSLFIKDAKLYLIALFIAPILSFLIYWIWSTLIIGVIFTPQMFVFIALGTILVPLYISITVGEWKSSNFLKQLKGFKYQETQLLTSLINICLLFSTLSVLTCGLVAYLCVNFTYAFPISASVFANLDWFIWLLYLLAANLATIVCLLFFITISNFAKTRYANVIFNILALIFILFLSDIILIPNVTAKLTGFWIIQFLSPVKYCMWVILMITSYQFLDPYGIRTILSTNNLSQTNISFHHIWTPLCIAFMFIVVVLILMKFKFAWGVKN